MISANDLTAMSSEAMDIVTRGRGEDYGHPEDCFATIATLWKAYLDARFDGVDLDLQAIDVARLMQLLKLARRIVAPHPKKDSFVDAIGYVLCEAQCETEELQC